MGFLSVFSSAKLRFGHTFHVRNKRQTPHLSHTNPSRFRVCVCVLFSVDFSLNNPCTSLMHGKLASIGKFTASSSFFSVFVLFSFPTLDFLPGRRSVYVEITHRQTKLLLDSNRVQKHTRRHRLSHTLLSLTHSHHQMKMEKKYNITKC